MTRMSMTMTSLIARLIPSRLRNFVRGHNFIRDRSGVAAVEFAIIVPFMLSLYIGGVELLDGEAITVKVTNTAHIVADLVTQNACVTTGTNGTLAAILNASTATIAPYSATPMNVTVSEVSTDNSGNATVTWSQAITGLGRPVGSAITLPVAYAGQKNISLIFGEVTYGYTPNLGYAITGTVNLKDSYYLFPRNSSTVTLASTCSS